MPEGPLLLVLLLPCRLELFDRRELAEELLRAPTAVAVEPPRVSYRTLSRLPDIFGAWLAFSQAKRLKLPGSPRAVVLFDPFLYPLARGLVMSNPGCELWYGPADIPEQPPRQAELHLLAAERSALTFVPSPALGQHEAGEGRRAVVVTPADTQPLWARMRSLGIA